MVLSNRWIEWSSWDKAEMIGLRVRIRGGRKFFWSLQTGFAAAKDAVKTGGKI
jgi:hypothetical protein